MSPKLLATVALLAIASGAAAHPLPAAKARVAARTTALDGIIGEVQLDALIARIVPADAARHPSPGRRVADAPTNKARIRG